MSSYYDDDNDNGAAGLIGLVLIAVSTGVYKIYKNNKKTKCGRCKIKFHEKHMGSIDFANLGLPHNEYLLPEFSKIQEDYRDNLLCDECLKIVTDNIYDLLSVPCNHCEKKYLPKDMNSIKPCDLEWPYGYDLPTSVSDILDEGSLLCNNCRLKLTSFLNKSLAIELDKLYVPCSLCGDKFLPNDLKKIKSINGIPDYWLKMFPIHIMYCDNCKGEDRFLSLIDEQKNKYNDIFEKSKVLGDSYPATYRGNLFINPHNVKKDIETNSYRDKKCADDELRVKAYIEGYDVVYNREYKRNYHQDDNYQYSTFYAIASFGKRLKK